LDIQHDILAALKNTVLRERISYAFIQNNAAIAGYHLMLGFLL